MHPVDFSGRKVLTVVSVDGGFLIGSELRWRLVTAPDSSVSALQGAVGVWAQEREAETSAQSPAYCPPTEYVRTAMRRVVNLLEIADLQPGEVQAFADKLMCNPLANGLREEIVKRLFDDIAKKEVEEYQTRMAVLRDAENERLDAWGSVYHAQLLRNIEAERERERARQEEYSDAYHDQVRRDCDPGRAKSDG